MEKCPHCQSEARQWKNGTSRAGSPRFQCTSCGLSHTPVAKVHGHPLEVRQQAVCFVLEGWTCREVAGRLGVSPQSVANWVALANAELEKEKEKIKSKAPPPS